MRTTRLHLSRSFWYGAGFSLLYSVLFFLWLLAKPGSHDLFVAVDNLAQTVGLLGAVILCFIGLRGSKQDRPTHERSMHLPRARRTWLPILLGLGIFSEFIGQAIYTYYEQGLHQAAPFPSWADACFLSAYPFLLLGILFLPTRPLSNTARSRVFLDGLMIMAAVSTFSWYFILGPTLLQGAGAAFAEGVGVAYPFFDLVLAFCLLLLSFRSSVPALRPAMYLLSLPLVIIIVTDSIFDYLTLQSAYATGGFVDIGWVLGYLLIGLTVQVLASLPAVQEAEGRAVQGKAVARAATADDPSLWRSLLPYALVPAVLLLAL